MRPQVPPGSVFATGSPLPASVRCKCKRCQPARPSARLTRVTPERARAQATPTGARGRCEMTKAGSKKMRAYVLIETAPGKTKAVKKELVAIQGSDSTVANLDAVTGPFDFIAVVEGPTLDAVGRLVTDEIGSIDGVTRTTTCLAVAIG